MKYTIKHLNKFTLIMDEEEGEGGVKGEGEGENDKNITIKLKNYKSNLVSGLKDLLRDDYLIDVTLLAEGQHIYAHKIILSLFSVYFKDLFKGLPCKHTIVVIRNVGYDQLKNIIRFMYEGKINMKSKDLKFFFQLAQVIG
ncbi:BTB domain transcription factor, putative [Pediculus humanus corporis]|uniref:BTB domain transcription factor, putative n=1 Tax=Pediculus humanus subsp. corporis TaxID=121224 RepID=E0VAA6_PEDHC|nr:BTB domain transcription factor, putative [Pediculus humanus corporis]EEB10311.1 BTB domain transcription factor, putative [Pediculus humanus corporis]